MSSYLSPQFKYMIFHVFTCNNGYNYAPYSIESSSNITRKLIISIVSEPIACSREVASFVSYQSRYVTKAYTNLKGQQREGFLEMSTINGKVI